MGTLLDFPRTDADLRACEARPTQDCLERHLQYRHSVATLFDAGATEALRRTFAALDRECAPAGSRQSFDAQRCRGAVTAFFFFHSASDDDAICEHLASLESAPLNNALIRSYGYRGDWVSNRPDARRWIAFVQSAPGLTAQESAGLREVFANPAAPHSGIALLDPRNDPRQR